MNHKILIIKHLTGQANQSEELQLSHWLAESPRNSELFSQLQNVWTAAEPPEVKNCPDVRLLWQKLERSFGLRLSGKAPNVFIWSRRPLFNTGQKIRFRPVMVYTALLLMLTIFIFWRTFNNPLLNVYTLNGETRTVDLPDGSTLQINSGSEISYQKKFTKTRRVNLSGEAFFTVLAGDEPFTVITENAQTTVLGTRFNVRSRNNRTRVTVQSGRVLFRTTTGPDSAVVLTAGLSGEIVAGQPPVVPEYASLEYDLGWLDHRLMFHKTSLAGIIGELQRYYNVTITTENVNADSLTVTGVFDSMPIDQVLSSICLTLDLQYYQAAGVYMIHN